MASGMRNQIANLYNALSVKGNDEQCFERAVITALHH